MKTKLVYVLTSAPDKNYCEQALLAVYTARYHNPEAYIVLIVDDLTNQLFTGKRAEILEYISEKVVVTLDEGMPMMERSRQLKTNVRNLVEGDLLFIDCDTLITRSLNEIDNCPYELGAVFESHLPVARFHSSLYEKVDKYATLLGWDLAKEPHYFSSGVIYAKDTLQNRLFFEKWNTNWNEGVKMGVSIDQPSFAKTDIESGHQIKRIDDRWNCVMFTHPLFDRESYILHFCSFRNMSYIFGDRFLDKVKMEGLKDSQFIRNAVIHPYSSYIPFENSVYGYSLTEYITKFNNIRTTAKQLALNLDYDDYIPSTSVYKYARMLFEKKMFGLGAFLICLYKFYRVKFDKKFKYVSNTCSADNF